MRNVHTPGATRSSQLTPSFTVQRGLQFKEDSSQKLASRHLNYYSPRAQVSEYGIRGQVHTDNRRVELGKRISMQNGTSLDQGTPSSVYMQGGNPDKWQTPKQAVPFPQNKQRISKQADKTSSIKPRSSQYNSSVHQTIVSELLEPRASRSVMDRIVVQNNILDNLRNIPDYEAEYFIPEDELKDIRRKHNSNIFQQMAPGRRLEEIFNVEHYRLIRTSGNVQLYSLQSNHLRMKLVMVVPHSQQKVLSALVDPSNYRLWNDQVDHGVIQLRICSENSVIAYQKHKAFGSYNDRDFLYIRHLFQKYGVTWMADRSFTHPDLPPLKNIKRQEIQLGLWAFQSKGNLSTKVTYMLQMSYEDAGSAEAIIKYMEEMGKLQEYLKATRVGDYFNPNWDIVTNTDYKTETCSNRPQTPHSDVNDDHYLTAFPQAQWLGSNMNSKQQPVHERQTLIANEQKPLLQKDNTLPINDTKSRQPENQRQSSMENLFPARCQGNVRESPLQAYFPATNIATSKFISTQTTVSDIPSLTRLPPVSNSAFQHPRSRLSEPKNAAIFRETPVQLDNNSGARQYLKVQHKIAPVKSVFRVVNRPDWKDYFLKNSWEILPSGELLFTNKDILKKHQGITGYLLAKITKNIISGKNPFEVSFPISIFSDLSFLEMFVRGMCFAPLFLERATSQADPVERIKLVVAFSIGYFNYFIDMAMPLNPILGETFQGWINGCPVYCEQISHHPPITSTYMVGRGYRVSATIESKIEIGINSIIGLNEGEFTVQFEGLHKGSVHFKTVNSQVSGVIFGDRTFNYIGKSHYYDDDGHFLELKYNPHKKGMFEIGKQTHPSDWVEGTIVKTSPAFVAKFRKDQKRAGPSKKETGPAMATIVGRWTQSIQVDGKQYYNRRRDQPCEIDQERYPLHSDSRYRGDIVCLRKNDKARAQEEKDRLETTQRADKKLREKMRKKAY